MDAAVTIKATLKAQLTYLSKQQSALNAAIRDNAEQLGRIIDAALASARYLPPESFGADVASFAECLADDGWFLDPEMSAVSIAHVARAMKNGEALGEVTPSMVNYFHRHLDAIQLRAVQVAPLRGPVLVDAFGAHREEKYSLSVPCLLAQADGILAEHFERNSVFRSRDRSRIAGGDARGIGAAMAEILLSRHPLWLRQGERSSSVGGLNRHAVLHGEDWEYGTRENSLRAVSFLNFACWLTTFRVASEP